MCSQECELFDFDSRLWCQMLKDFDFNEDDDKCPINIFNVRRILRRALLRGHGAITKIPFLVVIIKNINREHSDVTALVQDKTGKVYIDFFLSKHFNIHDEKSNNAMHFTVESYKN